MLSWVLSVGPGPLGNVKWTIPLGSASGSMFNSAYLACNGAQPKGEHLKVVECLSTFSHFKIRLYYRKICNMAIPKCNIFLCGIRGWWMMSLMILLQQFTWQSWSWHIKMKTLDTITYSFSMMDNGAILLLLVYFVSFTTGNEWFSVMNWYWVCSSELMWQDLP